VIPVPDAAPTEPRRDPVPVWQQEEEDTFRL